MFERTTVSLTLLLHWICAVLIVLNEFQFNSIIIELALWYNIAYLSMVPWMNFLARSWLLFAFSIVSFSFFFLSVIANCCDLENKVRTVKDVMPLLVITCFSKYMNLLLVNVIFECLFSNVRTLFLIDSSLCKSLNVWHIRNTIKYTAMLCQHAAPLWSAWFYLCSHVNLYFSFYSHQIEGASGL